MDKDIKEMRQKAQEEQDRIKKNRSLFSKLFKSRVEVSEEYSKPANKKEDVWDKDYKDVFHKVVDKLKEDGIPVVTKDTPVGTKVGKDTYVGTKDELAELEEKKEQEIKKINDKLSKNIKLLKADMDYDIKERDKELNESVKEIMEEMEKEIKDMRPSERKEIEDSYGEQLKEIKTEAEDDVNQIKEEYKEQIEDLKQEAKEKIDEIKECEYVEDLETEEDDDSNIYQCKTYRRMGPTFMQFVAGAIGLGIVLMVGYLVIAQVQSVIVSDSTLNATVGTEFGMTQDTIFAGFGLIAVGIVILMGFGLINIFNSRV